MPDEMPEDVDVDVEDGAVATSSPTSAVTNVYAKDKSSNNKDKEFDDDMTDDETMEEETTGKTKTNNKNSSSNSSGNTAVVFSPELLKNYYARLFPFELLHSWLAYNPAPSNKKNDWMFCRREFSMTIEPSPGEEIYIRYQSFTNREELTQAILKRRPTKIDLGAVFTHPPKDHKTLAKGRLLPVQRELVFDIDLTDYDDIRHCGCTGAAICSRCWVFMNMAVEVMDSGLREDFGFEHVAWFYSGRRGIHAWICDETARTLTNEARNAVATYFEVSHPTENNQESFLHLPLHPSLQRAFEILEPWFISDILPASGHGLLATEERWKKDLLDTIPEAGESVAKVLERKWRSDGAATSPQEKWDQLKTHIRVFIGRASSDGNSQSNRKGPKTPKTLTSSNKDRLELWPMEVVFRHTYPRLDINVSKTMNHLLKSPFCVHPKTGRVCVPIQPQHIRQFDPFAVPSLGQLSEELYEYEKKASKEEPSAMQEDEVADNPTRKIVKHDWQKTSLKEYFEPFQKEFLEPLHKAIRNQGKRQAEQEAAMKGDF